MIRQSSSFHHKMEKRSSPITRSKSKERATMVSNGSRMHFCFGYRPINKDGTISSPKEDDIEVQKEPNEKMQSSLGRARQKSFESRQNFESLASVLDNNPTDDARDDMKVQKDPKEGLRSALGGGELRNSNNPEPIESLNSFFDSTEQDSFLFPFQELQNDLHFRTNQQEHVASVNRATNYHPAQFIDFEFSSVKNNLSSHPSPVVSKFQEQSSPDSDFRLNQQEHVASANRTTNSDRAPYIGFDSSSSVKNNLSSHPSPVVSKFQEQSSRDSENVSPFLKRLSIDKDRDKAIRGKDSDGRHPGNKSFIGYENANRRVASSKSAALLNNQSSTRHKKWTKKEDMILRRAISNENDTTDWERISSVYFESTRSATQCKNRWTNYLRPGVIRGCWMPTEDDSIKRMFAEGWMWKDIAAYLPGRRPESIRDRYYTHLDPTLKKSPWTREEDEILFKSQLRIGNKWSEISKLLPGRSVNSIKNRFHNNKKKWLNVLNNQQMIGAARPSKKVRSDDLEESTTNPSPDLVESDEYVITI